MKVSIIVPVYCVEKYIERCLQSVEAQTFRNIECILVDDCGNDNSMDIVQQFVKNYVGDITFTIVHHDVNKGLSAARNTGIRAATGDYVFFLDSDDSLPPYSIMTLVKLAETYPDADFIQGNILDSDGNVSPYSFNNSIPEYCIEKEKLEMLMLHRVITSAWNRLIKRSTILDHNLFFPVGLIHEDMYWTCFFTKQVKAAAFTTIGTYTYYTNEESIMTATSKAMHIRRYKSRMVATKEYLADIRENGSNVYQNVSTSPLIC